MSHQIIISFDVDENAIRENAEKEIARQVSNAILSSAFGTNYSRDFKMSHYVQAAIKEILDLNRGQIISEAIKNVTDSISRSKAVRDRLSEALEDLDGKERS